MPLTLLSVNTTQKMYYHLDILTQSKREVRRFWSVDAPKDVDEALLFRF